MEGKEVKTKDGIVKFFAVGTWYKLKIEFPDEAQISIDLSEEEIDNLIAIIKEARNPQ